MPIPIEKLKGIDPYYDQLFKLREAGKITDEHLDNAINSLDKEMGVSIEDRYVDQLVSPSSRGNHSPYKSREDFENNLSRDDEKFERTQVEHPEQEGKDYPYRSRELFERSLDSQQDESYADGGCKFAKIVKLIKK